MELNLKENIFVLNLELCSIGTNWVLWVDATSLQVFKQSLVWIPESQKSCCVPCIYKHVLKYSTHVYGMNIAQTQ